VSDWVGVVGSLAGVGVGFAGSYRLATRQESGDASRQRALAVSEVMAAAGDVQLGVHAARVAYASEGQTAERFRLAGNLLSVLTPAYLKAQDLGWRALGEPKNTIESFDRLLRLDRERLRHHRQVIIDLSSLALTRSARFYAAVAAPPIRTEERLVKVKDAVIEAVGDLMQNITSKKREYDRHVDRLNTALTDFRHTAEALDERKHWWRRHQPTTKPESS
jgi:hypothetical protein